MQAEQNVVTRHLSSIRATRALDVGTGTGRYAALLATMGVASVIGADMSMGMLRLNRTSRRVCADANRLPLRSHAFDLVNASLIAGDITDLHWFVGELSRVLTAGGHLVYSDFHPAWDARGWQRTFLASDGQRHTLARASHQIGDHLEALAGAGLDVLAADEVTVTMTRRWLGRLRQPRAVPVAVVFHARKAS